MIPAIEFDFAPAKKRMNEVLGLEGVYKGRYVKAYTTAVFYEGICGFPQAFLKTISNIFFDIYASCTAARQAFQQKNNPSLINLAKRVSNLTLGNFCAFTALFLGILVPFARDFAFAVRFADNNQKVGSSNDDNARAALKEAEAKTQSARDNQQLAKTALEHLKKQKEQHEESIRTAVDNDSEDETNPADLKRTAEQLLTRIDLAKERLKKFNAARDEMEPRLKSYDDQIEYEEKELKAATDRQTALRKENNPANEEALKELKQKIDSCQRQLSEYKEKRKQKHFEFYSEKNQVTRSINAEIAKLETEYKKAEEAVKAAQLASKNLAPEIAQAEEESKSATLEVEKFYASHISQAEERLKSATLELEKALAAESLARKAVEALEKK